MTIGQKRRTITWKIEKITIGCEHCGGAIDGPVSGSTLWGWEDADHCWREQDGRAYCHGCGRERAIPVGALRALGVPR